MTKKNRGLSVSIAAGIVAIVLMVAVLLLHAFGEGTTPADSAADHSSLPATVASSAATTPATMIMPDGSVMNMGDMAPAADNSASAATTPQTMVMPDGSTMDMGDMGGSIDWQVIFLILALVAACISLGTTLNAHLRRQVTGGGALSEGATK
jgi:hypothetical protein